ncbi:MAG TPA: glycosyltransferase [Jiangellaceae bacterium]
MPLDIAQFARPARRLLIVVRADPVICGHAGEARNLAEVAVSRGFDDVRLITWPLDVLLTAGLPMKPLESVLPYSPGISVERPQPVGDYRVPDGRYSAGLTGRLVELFSDGVPTVCMSMYLSPHTSIVMEALTVARSAGAGFNVQTIAEAVGSDVTNVVRSCLRSGQLGAAIALFSTYLANDKCVAVSAYTRDLILSSAREVDRRCGTRFAAECERRVTVSFPAVDSSAFLVQDPSRVEEVLARRGLMRDGYVLFLSRVTRAKGADDLVAAFRAAATRASHRLVIAGNGPALAEIQDMTRDDDRVLVLTDVTDEEKPALMAGCAAFTLPSKPAPDFVETFGIALVEEMLAGGGPVITTNTGGIPEAVGDTALVVPAGDVAALAAAIDHAVLAMSPEERAARAARAAEHALQFDRVSVFDQLFADVTLAAAG